VTAERWERVKQIFERARGVAPEKRGPILDDACGSDAELRGEVESLLGSLAKAGRFLEDSAAATPGSANPDWSAVDSEETELLPPPTAAFGPGAILAGRYEIQQLLGRGGMGAVYKARDRELDREVALKVIRPELAHDEQVLHRFKRELILARQVTHRNVIRIYDLGSAEGFKFISMEYLEGRSLSSLLKERVKLPAEDAVTIIKQVCEGLAAAHAQGVVHRDLKPQNIMVDAQGRVVLMDFGIARSVESTTGMTRTGSLLGTPAYMSPEQAKSEPVDARSDIFSLGIIFYELLTGQIPFQSETAMGSLLKRCQEQAVPPARIDATIPAVISEITLKALATRPADRYQSAADMLNDLERRQGTSTTGLSSAPGRKNALPWNRIGAGISLLLAAGAVWFGLWSRIGNGPPPAPKPITVLVADFDNRTADPVFDGTLEPMFTIGLEGASFITSYRADQAHRLLRELRPGSTRLDAPAARLLAAREGINVILTGSIARRSSGFQVRVQAADGVTGAAIVSKESGTVARDGVLGAVGNLVPPIRKALGDLTPESVQLASAETYTSVSLEAAHDYAAAQSEQWLAKLDDAAKLYAKAAQEDPSFGRAYAGLATVYQNQGRRQEAEEYYQKAFAHMNHMTDREKYRTRGPYFLLIRDGAKAAEEYGALVRQYPFDNAGYANLALAYLYMWDMPRALEAGRKAIAINPKNVLQRDNVALYAMYAGDFAGSEREAKAVLQENPSYERAYVAMALSELAQGRITEAAAFYEKLQGVSKLGAAFGADGLADLAMYQGRPAEAAALLEKATSGNVPPDATDASIAGLVKLAQAYSLQGQTTRAITTVQKAVSASQIPAVLFPAARIYLDAGDGAKALDLAAQLSKRLEAEPRAYAKLVEGEALLKRGKIQEALDAFRSSKQFADTWISHYDSGLAYLAAKSLPEASSEFDLCLKRRGEATALFLDEIPTYWLLPPVYYYMGRTQEELKSPAAAESFRSYLSFKENAAADPLAEDARRRIARSE